MNISSDPEQFVAKFARVGDTATEWPNVHRLQLRDGKAIERVTYFDALALLPTLLRHPSLGWRWWRSGSNRQNRTIR